MSFIMMTPHETTVHLAKKSKAKRLSMNFSQKTLSERSGVSYGVLKKFERTGQISLKSLLQIAVSLDALEGFYDLFNEKKPEDMASLDELIAQKTRQRGRE